MPISLSRKEIIGFAKVLITFVVIWILAIVYNLRGCASVNGGEMSPTVQKGNKMVEPGITDATEFDYDDIVIYRYAMRNRVGQTAARVVGLPGDAVRLEEGKVFVNGKEINSEYVAPQYESKDNYEEVMVPRGTLFVLCDARRMGVRIDSRAVGPIGIWTILGRM